jgi:predicted metal-dependent peptidase
LMTLLLLVRQKLLRGCGMSKDNPIENGRLWLIAKRPYLASGVFRLHYVESKDVPTLGVSKRWVCYYNPEYCSGLSVQELGTAICHELYHLLRLHCERRSGREQVAWNVASDLEINDDLSDLRLPPKVLTPRAFGFPEGKTAEEYYDMLPDGEIELPPIGGSSSDGIERPWESHEDEGLSDMDSEVARRKVAQDIVDAGDAPGDLKRWADELLRPTVKWYQVLRRQLYYAAGLERGLVDYSYRRRNRRQTGEVVLPSFVKPKLSAAVIIDTSGSVESNELNRFVTECGALVRLCDEVICYIFDMELIWKGKINSVEKISQNLRGRGGTRMDLAIEMAVNDGHRLIVLFTDGETPWPDTRPRGRLIVVTANKPGPKWAYTVKI